MSKSRFEQYRDCTDEELVEKFRQGEAEAADYLMEKYKVLVRSRARALYLVGGDRDDLLQEGMLGLFRAIRQYRPEAGEDGRKASFATYAATCITRQMYTAIAASQRKKNQPLNRSVSIDEMQENQTDYQLGRAESPESIILGKESADSLREQIWNALSPYEKKVLEKYLEGMDYRAIAEALGKPPKSVDNALQRIRGKVAELTGR